MTKADRIRHLWATTDLSDAEIARQVRCDYSFPHYVRKRDAGRAARLANQEKRRAERRAECLRIANEIAKNKVTAKHKHAAVIAAVDAGMTYGAAAKHFRLASRNVVAGIMNRRPEACA